MRSRISRILSKILDVCRRFPRRFRKSFDLISTVFGSFSITVLHITFFHKCRYLHVWKITYLIKMRWFLEPWKAYFLRVIRANDRKKFRFRLTNWGKLFKEKFGNSWKTFLPYVETRREILFLLSKKR